MDIHSGSPLPPSLRSPPTQLALPARSSAASAARMGAFKGCQGVEQALWVRSGSVDEQSTFVPGTRPVRAVGDAAGGIRVTQQLVLDLGGLPVHGKVIARGSWAPNGAHCQEWNASPPIEMTPLGDGLYSATVELQDERDAQGQPVEFRWAPFQEDAQGKTTYLVFGMQGDPSFRLSTDAQGKVRPAIYTPIQYHRMGARPMADGGMFFRFPDQDAVEMEVEVTRKDGGVERWPAERDEEGRWVAIIPGGSGVDEFAHRRNARYELVGTYDTPEGRIQKPSTDLYARKEEGTQTGVERSYIDPSTGATLSPSSDGSGLEYLRFHAQDELDAEKVELLLYDENGKQLDQAALTERLSRIPEGDAHQRNDLLAPWLQEKVAQFREGVDQYGLSASNLGEDGRIQLARRGDSWSTLLPLKNLIGCRYELQTWRRDEAGTLFLQSDLDQDGKLSPQERQRDINNDLTDNTIGWETASVFARRGIISNELEDYIWFNEGEYTVAEGHTAQQIPLAYGHSEHHNEQRSGIIEERETIHELDEEWVDAIQTQPFGPDGPQSWNYGPGETSLAVNPNLGGHKRVRPTHEEAAAASPERAATQAAARERLTRMQATAENRRVQQLNESHPTYTQRVKAALDHRKQKEARTETAAQSYSRRSRRLDANPSLASYFDRLHQREIKVIRDLVMNHAHGKKVWGRGSTNWFFNWAVMGSEFQPREVKSWGKMPAFNNPDVYQFYLDLIAYSINVLKVDDFRFDFLEVIRNQGGEHGQRFVRDAARLIKLLKPDSSTVVEDFTGDRIETLYDPAVVTPLEQGGYNMKRFQYNQPNHVMKQLGSHDMGLHERVATNLRRGGDDQIPVERYLELLFNPPGIQAIYVDGYRRPPLSLVQFVNSIHDVLAVDGPFGLRSILHSWQGVPTNEQRALMRMVYALGKFVPTHIINTQGDGDGSMAGQQWNNPSTFDRGHEWRRELLGKLDHAELIYDDAQRRRMLETLREKGANPSDERVRAYLRGLPEHKREEGSWNVHRTQQHLHANHASALRGMNEGLFVPEALDHPYAPRGMSLMAYSLEQEDRGLFFISNWGAKPLHDVQIPFPARHGRAPLWSELLNSGSRLYGGTNEGNGGVLCSSGDHHGINIPACSVVVFGHGIEAPRPRRPEQEAIAPPR